jgi:hypothetical protein
MRSFRDFDRDFEATRRRIQRQNRAMVALMLFVSLLIGISAVWLAEHPEAIGSFVGRIAAGFREEVTRG